MMMQAVGVNKAVARPLPATKVGTPYLESSDIVIVGNGIAGLTAAIEARRLAPDKRIVIITDQNHPTINTPALKQFAIGKLQREQLLAFPPGTELSQRLHLINERVESINAIDKYVSMSRGRAFGYDSLLIATGSRPGGLPATLPGRDFDGILTLHRLQDYLDLRRRLSEVEEVVVIGGGAHAVETVMGLLYLGRQVHWLIRGATLMPKMLDTQASNLVLERIQRAGARIHTETEAIGIVGRVGVVAGVVTNHNEMIPCQLVIVCTGTSPVTSLAEQCNLPIKHKQGILVDEQLRTSVRDIYAAGDVAALPNPQTGEYETRALWYAATLQGRTAAAAMTGHPEATTPLGVPWHATHLGDLSMLTVGNPFQKGNAIPVTSVSKGSYRLLSVVDDRLVGYLSLGQTQPDSLAIKRIIEEGLPIRDIQKDLLKGQFDARHFFSRQRSFVAEDMIRTGKLPAIQPLQPSPAWSSTTKTKHTQHTLPVMTERHTDCVGCVWVFVEISPFTGNLPAIRKKVIESTLVPLPPAEMPAGSRSLWSYGQKEQPATKNNQLPSRSLWSYGTGKGLSS